tara:strand:+ start:575 stop:817 length:243 start_codon:yes stop_codon:yes gene_type:complete
MARIKGDYNFYQRQFPFDWAVILGLYWVLTRRGFDHGTAIGICTGIYLAMRARHRYEWRLALENGSYGQRYPSGRYGPGF